MRVCVYVSVCTRACGVVSFGLVWMGLVVLGSPFLPPCNLRSSISRATQRVQDAREKTEAFISGSRRDNSSPHTHLRGCEFAHDALCGADPPGGATGPTGPAGPGQSALE